MEESQGLRSVMRRHNTGRQGSRTDHPDRIVQRRRHAQSRHGLITDLMHGSCRSSAMTTWTRSRARSPGWPCQKLRRRAAYVDPDGRRRRAPELSQRHAVRGVVWCGVVEEQDVQLVFQRLDHIAERRGSNARLICGLPATTRFPILRATERRSCSRHSSGPAAGGRESQALDCRIGQVEMLYRGAPQTCCAASTS